MSHFMTVRQAAQHFNASERTIRRWISKGDLVAHRVGPRFIRIEVGDLERLARPVPTARI